MEQTMKLSGSRTNGPAQTQTANSKLPSGPKFNSKLMQKDLQEMMFGFGDAWPSNKESLGIMELLVKQHIEELCQDALKIAEIKGKMDVDCFLFAIRKDPRKFHRVQSLLNTNEQLKKARTVDEISNIM